MKKLIFLSLILVSVLTLQSCATLETIESQVTEKVVQLDGKTQDELYIRANTWMVEKFNNAESVIQFSDKPNGIVIGKYTLSQKAVDSDGLEATRKNTFAIIKIQVKDSAAKITITPQAFSIYAMESTEKTVQKVQTEVDELIGSFIESIGVTESTEWD